MTTQELAAADQAEAAEREWDQKAARVARWGLTAFAPFATYAVLASAGILPTMPWALG